MCLGVPHKVLQVNSQHQQITIEAYGEQRVVSSMLLADRVAVGDYVLVQAGGFASEQLSVEQALESLTLLEKIQVISYDSQ